MSAHSTIMENLPETFCFPNLRSIVREFKGTRDHLHPMMDMASLETSNWISSYKNMDKRWFAIMEYTRSDYLVALEYPDIDVSDLGLVVDAGKLSQEKLRMLVQMLEDVMCNRSLETGEPLPLVIEILQFIWGKFCERKRPCFERLLANGWIDWATSLLQIKSAEEELWLYTVPLPPGGLFKILVSMIKYCTAQR
ncbi:hypothetical protein DFH08DRAFT_819860 [Mycena albidolilacea]|uniref:Uncharacterized protein n=1 Tax=Mycena albidolilacea TaxID=1033008 RepID=A0AAD6ZDK3_9AGAR|nr:hypothetical protein DFH08DRAFT_819860 [Mycena albidolilacea]